jgi:phosphate transport system ATP-binding protein
MAAPAESILSIRDFSFWYADGSRALNDVCLELPKKAINVLFGPARSGKSTLLRAMNRLSDLAEGSRHDGEIRFRGRDVFLPDTDLGQLRREISMVFAIPTPLPGSIMANMTYGMRMAGLRDPLLMEERVERGLRRAALWDEVKDRLDSSAFALSGGQKQRLCIARSLALEPEVLLLDNPTSGLDPLSTAAVEEALTEIKAEFTVVMVPHSVQQAARIADHAAFILGGELVEAGVGSQLFLHPSDRRTEDYVTGRFG